MQFLTTTRVYDVGRDATDAAFLRLINHPPDGLIILDGNAGLGADWPAGIWKSLSGLAIALAIISAPATIEENWPRWKAIFDNITQKIMEFHGEFRIDRDTAQVLAMHHAVAHCGLMPERMSVHMAIRHYFTATSGYEDLLKTDRINMQWAHGAEWGSKEFTHGVSSNEEAARQARCRYIFGIEDASRCTTIVVEQDGTISLAKELEMQSNWG